MYDGLSLLRDVLLWLLLTAITMLLTLVAPWMAQLVALMLFALSLDLLVGYARIVSLGHAAFLGVGAYTAVAMYAFGWHEPVSALLASALVAALLGYLSSLVVLRGGVVFVSLMTLLLGLMAAEVVPWASQFVHVPADWRIKAPLQLFGHFALDAPRTALLYALVVCVMCFFFVRKLVSSHYGLALWAIRGNAPRAAALGIDTRARLRLLYCVAAGMAGLAGALFAQITQHALPGYFNVQRSLEALAMLALGGAGYLWGAVLGAGLVGAARHVLDDVDGRAWLLALGVLLIAAARWLPGGLLGSGAASAVAGKPARATANSLFAEADARAGAAATSRVGR